MENIQPSSAISDLSPIVFDISGQNGMEYINLQKCQMYVKLRVLHADNIKLEDNESVAPVNLLLQSLFSQIDVSIQGKLLSSTSEYHPYKAFIQSLLRYGSDAKQSQLSSQLWLKDSPSQYDDVNFTNGDNTNGLIRSSYIKGSMLIDLQGPIMHDLFQVGRYLLYQVGVSIRFHRSRPDFSLLSNTDKAYRIDIQQMELRINKVPVNPGVITAHSAMLNVTNAKYPYNKTEIASMTLAKGTLNFSWNQVFQDKCPNKVLICKQDQKPFRQIDGQSCEKTGYE